MKNWILYVVLTGIFLITLGGCMSTGGTWETREPSSDQTELIIRRPWNYWYSQLNLDLVLDQGSNNQRVVHMGNGKEIRMIIPNGEHTLTVILDTSRMDQIMTKEEKGKTVAFSASGNPVVYKLTFKGSAMTGLRYIWTKQ